MFLPCRNQEGNQESNQESNQAINQGTIFDRNVSTTRYGIASVRWARRPAAPWVPVARAPLRRSATKN